MPLSGALERHAARNPENPAFHLDGRVLSYGALAATARRLHATFSEMAPEGQSSIGPDNQLVALVTGLVVGAFQAATQINEMTLSFIPKLIAMAATLVIAGPWMLKVIVGYTRELFESIPGMIN